jgi:hypothetical protein
VKRLVHDPQAMARLAARRAPAAEPEGPKRFDEVSVYTPVLGLLLAGLAQFALGRALWPKK